MKIKQSIKSRFNWICTSLENLEFNRIRKLTQINNRLQILLFLYTALILLSKSNAQSSQKMYAWGSQEYGQLGNDEFANPTAPVKVDQWVTVAGGDNHTVGINSSGELYAWGDNRYGQLGLGNTNYQSLVS